MNQWPVADLFILCDKNERCCKEGQSRRIGGEKVRLRDCQCALSFIFLGFSGFVKEKVEWGNANTDDATTPIAQISGERGAQNKQIRRDVLMCGASTGSALGLYLFTHHLHHL